jgi:SAM-dependent methyltransferase
VKCCTCGLIRTNPRPTLDTMNFYYPANYGPYLATQANSASALRTSFRSKLKQVITGMFRFNTQVIPRLSPGRMLEVGCASGAYLQQMAGQGWQVEGIEPDTQAATRARQLGYHVYTGSIESAPDPDEVYDIVVAWMVLEHLHEPVTALRKFYNWTSHKGWLVFSVPNTASLEASLFKDAWYALDLPRHLYHFTPSTLECVLGQTGWKIKRILHQRSLSNLFASIGLWLQDHRIDNRFVRWLLKFPEASWRWHQLMYPLAFLFSLFGQTGRITVWARKADS